MLDLLIITGASRGIGANIAKQCNTDVAEILITISSSGKTDHISRDNNLISLVLNLTDHKKIYESVKGTIDQLLLLKKISNIGIVLCGAQIGNPGGLLTSDLDDWDTLYNCNVLGNLAVVKACSKLLESTESKIVFFAGGGAAFSYPEFSGYALSKVATVRAAENLGAELSAAGFNSSVIAISPGAVATEMLDKVIAVGGEVRTKTDISEPTNFVYRFLNNEFPSKKLNGKFIVYNLT